MGFAQIRGRILMIGARPLVRDNVRVLLGTMGYSSVSAATLDEALPLVEQERPAAAILDLQHLGSQSSRTVAAFHKMFPSLRGRAIVLASEVNDPELVKLIDAYSLSWVPEDLVFQELWPSLDLLLRRSPDPPRVVRSARLVFDSDLQPLAAGVRSAQPWYHSLLYESEDLMVDLWLEPQPDMQRVKLVGQVLDRVKRAPALPSVSVVLQGQGGPIAVAATNQSGEFQFDFDFEPGAALEIAAKADHWISVHLPDPKDACR